MSSISAFFRVLVSAFLIFCTGVHASFASTPRVIVVLTDCLSYSDFANLPQTTSLGPTWSSSTATGLMSVGLASKPDPVANVYATLGAGDSIRVGDISQGRLGEALKAAGKRIALIGSADGDDTGEYRPALQMIPLPDVVSGVDGTVVDPLAPGGRRTDPTALAQAVDGVLETCDLVVVHLGDLERLEREQARGLLTPEAYRLHRRAALLQLPLDLWAIGRTAMRYDGPVHFYFIAADPAPEWNRLTPVAIEAFRGRPLAGLLTSTTTRAPGLIAARDLAPSILTDLHVPVPIQMTGAPIESRPASTAEVGRTLEHLDRMTNFDQRAQSPFFWGLGVAGGLVIFIAFFLFLAGKPVGSPVVLYLLRVLSSWPLALLLVWLVNPQSMPSYLAWIGFISLLVGLLPNPPIILFTTALVIVVDAFFGSRLVSQTILSAYMMSGIRFYGIGNEYMGVLIGGSLMAPIVFERFFTATKPAIDKPEPAGATTEAENPGVRFALPIFLSLVVFVLSFPAFGAKAGGAVTAMSTFLFLWWELKGIRIGARHIATAIVAGFALVFVWATLARWLHLTPTHIDTAVGALKAGRFGYIIGVAERKTGLALRVALHPGTIVGATALVVLGIALRFTLRDHLSALWSRKPVYRAVVAAGLRGAAVALFVNDSGIIAAILLAISLLLPVLYNIFEENSESRIVNSESKKPFAGRGSL